MRQRWMFCGVQSSAVSFGIFAKCLMFITRVSESLRRLQCFIGPVLAQKVHGGSKCHNTSLERSTLFVECFKADL
jgi:hypothetical protein